MISNLDSLGFKFKIGDIATHKLKSSKEWSNAKELKTSQVIINGRIAEECSGGVQYMYRVRIGLLGSNMTTFDPDRNPLLHEHELEEYKAV